MFRFPFSSYPYNYPYYKYYNYHNNNIPHMQPKQKENSITNSIEFSNTINSKSSSNSDEQAIFEIFGIKLYLDDLIILGLLFFLY